MKINTVKCNIKMATELCLGWDYIKEIINRRK